MALRRRGLAETVVGVGRGSANLALARRRRMLDQATTDPLEGVQDADLVVLATPVGMLAEIAKRIAPGLRPGAIVTDAGSVKEGVVRAITPVMPPHAHFVGGHPIAGGEVSGAGAARSNLFEGSHCILTPTPQTDLKALRKIERLWRSVGADVVQMDAATHDRIFGAISHLPHVVAFAVVNAVASANPDALAHAGSGFRDFTRIAASHPEAWRDIVLSNREQILASMASAEKELAAIRDLIERQDAERLLDTFRRAGESRRSLQAPGSGARKRGRKRKT